MDSTAAIPHVWSDARGGLLEFDTWARALLGEGRLRMASRNDGKDFTMASKDSSSSSKVQEQESNKKSKESKGQKTSSERGTATSQKKNPGKRPQQGGSSR